MILGSNLAKNNRFLCVFGPKSKFLEPHKKLRGLIFYNCIKVGRKLVLFDRIVILPEKILFWGQTLDGKTSRTEKPLGRKKIKM